MPISVNFSNKIVYITSPTITVTVQELVNAIRDAEDELINLSYDKVIDATGKDNLGGGLLTAITMQLNPDWYIEFWSGCVLGIVRDGNIVGGLNSRPVRAATGSGDTVLQLGSVGGVIGSISGTIPTAEEVAHAVWSKPKTELNITDSAGQTLVNAEIGIGDTQALIFAK